MDKYIGNKKVIVDGIEAFLKKKRIKKGMFIDVFAGTTNVSQYFKQKGYGIICNDINEFSYIFGKVYIENNSFPQSILWKTIIFLVPLLFFYNH